MSQASTPIIAQNGATIRAAFTIAAPGIGSPQSDDADDGWD
jgi:hypothetical protein